MHKLLVFLLILTILFPNLPVRRGNFRGGLESVIEGEGGLSGISCLSAVLS